MVWCGLFGFDGRMRGVSMFLLSLYLPFVVGLCVEREREWVRVIERERMRGAFKVERLGAGKRQRG